MMTMQKHNFNTLATLLVLMFILVVMVFCVFFTVLPLCIEKNRRSSNHAIMKGTGAIQTLSIQCNQPPPDPSLTYLLSLNGASELQQGGHQSAG